MNKKLRRKMVTQSESNTCPYAPYPFKIPYTREKGEVHKWEEIANAKAARFFFEI